MITIQTDTGELQGHDFISRLFCGTVNWFGHLMSDIAGSSGGRGNANGGRGSGIVIPFYELFGLCDFGSFQVGENRNTLAVLATKAFQDGYDARWGLTMAIPVVLCDLSIRFIWSVRRFFGDKKQLSECIPSDKQPDLRMMVLVGNGTLCIVDGVDAAVRSGGNMLVFFMHLNLIAWYKLVKRVLAELIIRYDLSYADLAVYIEKINQELNQQLQVLRAIDYDAYEKELAQINTISGLLDDKQTCTDKIYQKLNEMRVNRHKGSDANRCNRLCSRYAGWICSAKRRNKYGYLCFNGYSYFLSFWCCSNKRNIGSAGWWRVKCRWPWNGRRSGGVDRIESCTASYGRGNPF